MRLSFHKKNFYRSRRVSKVDNTFLDLNNPSDHTRQSNNFFFLFKKILFIQNHCIPKGQAKICLPPSMFKFSFSFAYSFNLAPGDEMEGKHRVKKVSHGKVALLGTLRSSKTVIESIVSLHVILIFRENHV